MNASDFIRFCLRFYGGMAISGLALAWFIPGVEFFQRPIVLWNTAFCVLGIPLCSLLMTQLLLCTRLGRDLLDDFHKLLPRLSGGQRMIVAFSSGFGEEILFRGALLPWLGLTVSSLAFGLLHWPVRPALRVWTIYAVLMGFLLGEATLVTGSVWVAALAHALTNWVGFTLIERRRWGWLHTRNEQMVDCAAAESEVADGTVTGEDSGADRQT